ncbi:MAG: 1-acyl-sn-glycerol-3-phosphate acyltransferase [Rhodobacteraceae bacterium]|nr:1-acyl-sn-glycerol-3-phosphate acyltransferase [Paracoccaceae bacterium]
MAWNEVEPEALPDLGLIGWVRFTLRAVFFAFSAIILVFLLVVTYGLERLTGGRWLSSKITRLWGRIGRMCCGLTLEIQGKEMKHGGAIVANHSSWMDIFTMHNAAHIHFVSKSEVAKWPGIGFMARVSGTIFIVRKPTEAKRQQIAMAERIFAGDKLCFFPEGTSSDGLRVLPFKSSLFSVFYTEELRDNVWVQPVSVSYIAPKNRPRSFYGWWGDMEFFAHAKVIFGLSKGGRVVVTFHPPLKAANFENRKQLSEAAEILVRAGVEKNQQAAL